MEFAIDDDIVTALLIGLASGSFGGLLGIGGGTLFVPALLLIMGQEQHTAQGISLVVIIPTAMSATAANLKRGYVDEQVAMWVAPVAVLFALTGAVIAGQLEGDTLSRVFGIVVLYVGSRSLYTNWKKA